MCFFFLQSWHFFFFFHAFIFLRFWVLTGKLWDKKPMTPEGRWFEKLLFWAGSTETQQHRQMLSTCDWSPDECHSQYYTAEMNGTLFTVMLPSKKNNTSALPANTGYHREKKKHVYVFFLHPMLVFIFHVFILYLEFQIPDTFSFSFTLGHKCFVLLFCSPI